MFGKAARRCVQCWGTIVKNGRQGGSGTISVTVEFQANGLLYRFEEPLRMKSSVITMGPIPIGRQWTPVLERSSRGDAVVVCYDPNDPRNAKIRDNVGGITVE